MVDFLLAALIIIAIVAAVSAVCATAVLAHEQLPQLIAKLKKKV